MAQYEYKIISGIGSWSFLARLRRGMSGWAKEEKQLNDLTADGWEIVSTHTTSAISMLFGCGSPNMFITFVLRRPRPQPGPTA